MKAPARAELRLWMVGLGLWGLIAIEVAAAFAVRPSLGQGMLVGIGAEVFTGRESGVPSALAAGVPPWLVFQLSFTQDIASALLVYPLFLYLLHRWRDSPHFIMERMRRIEAAAERHEAYVKRWGPLGIGLFMLVPFLVNGPMVGLIVGRIAGIHTRYVLPAVVIATVIAAALWTVAFEQLILLGTRIDDRAGIIIAVAMVLVVVLVALVDFVRETLAQR